MAEQPQHQGDITALLQLAATGDKEAEAALYSAVAQELRRLAAYHVRGERNGCSWQATELFHEAFGRLKLGSIQWQSRRDFYRVMSTVMKRTLIDKARKEQQKRKFDHIDLGNWEATVNTDSQLVLLVADLVEKLEKTKPQLARTIEMRFYAGFAVKDIAAILRVDRRTVARRLDEGLELLRSIAGAQPPPSNPVGETAAVPENPAQAPASRAHASLASR